MTSSSARPGSGLVVAVTGPTGTFGEGLVPLLQDDDRVERIVGIARRPFDPAEQGWTKMTYQQGDVRDPDSLEKAFRGADVVVHLAFLITGNASRETIRAVNVEGTLNTFRAAAAAGVQRFVYASSVAAYGFHSDNPVGMTEDWPVRPAASLFYAQEKAELEQLLADESDSTPEMELYLLRPPIVVGPHAVGAKSVPGVSSVRRSPVPLPVPVPPIPLQLIHEQDVGRAIVQCVVAAGPPGRVQHQRGRDGHRGRRRPRLRAVPAAVPGAHRPAARRHGGAAAVPAAGRAVGRGGEPSRDHGHHQGEVAAALAPALQRAGGIARNLRRR